MPVTFDRRELLKSGLILPAAMAIPGTSKATFTAPASVGGRPKLKILILGGTRFIGPAMISEALARGHDVTLFNRGETRSWLFPGVAQLRGNRYPEKDGGLRALEKGEWDAVIDIPAYFPRIVDASAGILKDRARKYLMMSSISSYADFRTVGIKEDYPLRKLNRGYEERADLSEDWDFATYGARKALGEAELAKHFGDRWVVLRASGVAGGGMSDPSKWVWPARLATMPVVAAAGDGRDHMQIVDRRDIAAFALHALESDLAGTFNVVGTRTPFAEVLETTRKIVGSNAKIVWTGDKGREMLGPLPNAAPEARVPGFAAVNGDKALAAGLKLRPLADTIAADWLWFRENHPLDFDFYKAKHAPDPAAERKLLEEMQA